MQATHYIADEIERRHGPRDEPSLRAHTQFAEEVLGENQNLTQPQAFHKGHTIFHDLLVFTSDRPWVFVVWALEIFWLLFVVTACTMEMWGSCSFEMGQTSYCSYCYSSPFLVFLFGLVTIWFFNLYTYVLLLSRGFQLRLRYLGLAVQRNEEKGIPAAALYLFMVLSTVMFVWLIGGLVMLISSETCRRGGVLYGNRPGRSFLLFATVLVSIIITPLLFFAGRCEDAKGTMKRLCS